jgi:gliding motility-associated-like protein
MKLLLSVMLSLLFADVLSQQRAMHWVFGGTGGLDFSCSPPRFELSSFDGLEGASSISDESGNLLFYSDGNLVWNRMHRKMPNGEGIGGLCTYFGNYSSSSQSSLIVPHPGNANLYYIFTTDCAEDEFSWGLRYSIVDMSLENGLGDVTVKDQPLVSPSSEKIAAVYHANGSDVWVVTHGIANNNFYAYLVSASGINTNPVISSTGQVHAGGRGYLKFSPDGKRLASVSFVSGYDDGEYPELFTFDESTGKIQSQFTLPGVIRSQYSLSFSPDGTKLYTSCSWTCGGKIIQFDVSSGNQQQILNSKFTFDEESAAFPYGGFQLGPDGKLYFMCYITGVENYLGVIENPNKAGVLAGYNANYLHLPYCRIAPSWGLPNFVESYFKNPIAGASACSPADLSTIRKVDFEIIRTEKCKYIDIVGTSEIAIEPATPNRRITWQLDFGDGETTSGVSAPGTVSHQYNDKGIYNVKLSITDPCEVKFASKSIEIEGLSLGFNHLQSCEDYVVEFKNSTSNFPEGTDLQWKFEDSDKIVTSVDATHSFASPGTYAVTLIAKSPDQCISTLEKDVKIYPPLKLELGDDILICAGDAALLSGTENDDANFEWSTGQTLPSISVVSEAAYSLTITRNNCSVSDEVKVNVDSDCFSCEINVPNVFTPDGFDDLNSYFSIQSDCDFASYSMKIYDRYGKILFHTNNLSGWNGKVRDEMAPAGIYYFIIDFERIKLNKTLLRETRKGWIQLIR